MSFLESESIVLRELVAYGKNKLDIGKISNSKKEIDWFLEEKLSISISDIKLNQNRVLNKKEISLFFKFIDRRIKGEPFQYIINKATFYGCDYFVNENTLIPRPETELIIDIAKQHGSFNRALDIGTGSGNIAITLAMKKIVKEVDAIDISIEAVKIAIGNAKTYGLNNVNFFQHDFINNPILCKYDLIVSNPPYISYKVYQNLENHIKSYEPQIALTDHCDGLTFYTFFAKNLSTILSPHGRIILEIGYEETKQMIEEIFTSEGFLCVWHRDLNNNYRALECFYE
jgi:release factor glutamine methyltransferase